VPKQGVAWQRGRCAAGLGYCCRSVREVRADAEWLWAAPPAQHQEVHPRLPGAVPPSQGPLCDAARVAATEWWLMLLGWRVLWWVVCRDKRALEEKQAKKAAAAASGSGGQRPAAEAK